MRKSMLAAFVEEMGHQHEHSLEEAKSEEGSEDEEELIGTALLAATARIRALETPPAEFRVLSLHHLSSMSHSEPLAKGKGNVAIRLLEVSSISSSARSREEGGM